MPDKDAENTKAVPPSKSIPVDRAIEIIDRWWDDHMPGSPLAVATDAYNHVHGAVEELKRRLRGAAA